MSVKPENAYIKRVHDRLDAAVHREKTHNRFRRGMPDVYYEGTQACLWVEYKWHPTRPHTLNVAKMCSPLQQRWLRRAANNGRPVAVILGCPFGGVILPQLEWENPLNTPTLLSLPEIAKWIENQTIR